MSASRRGLLSGDFRPANLDTVIEDSKEFIKHEEEDVADGGNRSKYQRDIFMGVQCRLPM